MSLQDLVWVVGIPIGKEYNKVQQEFSLISSTPATFVLQKIIATCVLTEIRERNLLVKFGKEKVTIFAPPSLTQEAAVCCALLFESQEWC